MESAGIILIEEYRKNKMTNRLRNISDSIKEIDNKQSGSNNTTNNTNNTNNDTNNTTNKLLYTTEDNEVTLLISPLTNANQTYELTMIGGGIIYPSIRIMYIDNDFVSSNIIDKVCISRNNSCYVITTEQFEINEKLKQKHPLTKEIISADNKQYLENNNIVVNYPIEEGIIWYNYSITLVKNNGELLLKYSPGDTEYTYKLRKVNIDNIANTVNMMYLKRHPRSFIHFSDTKALYVNENKDLIISITRFHIASIRIRRMSILIDETIYTSSTSIYDLSNEYLNRSPLCVQRRTNEKQFIDLDDKKLFENYGFFIPNQVIKEDKRYNYIVTIGSEETYSVLKFYPENMEEYKYKLYRIC
jgi:hypothetical protein